MAQLQSRPCLLGGGVRRSGAQGVGREAVLGPEGPDGDAGAETGPSQVSSAAGLIALVAAQADESVG